MTKERVTSLAQARKMWPEKEYPTRGGFIDLAGKKFFRWSVLYCADYDSRRTYWVCKCSCGTFKAVLAQNLRNGRSVSCGCYGDEIRKETHWMTHGQTRGKIFTKEYGAWVGMKNRCYNKKNKCYNRYGGRGILICDSWKDSFENFYHDMGEAPSPEHSIDRIHNDDGYCPDNCRWATLEEQSLNKHNSLYFTLNEETLALRQWAQKLSISYHTLYDRIVTRKWSVERALTASVRKR